MIQIILADDHAVMRRGLRLVLEQQEEFKVLGKNSLSEFSMASPALVGDRLIIRTQSNLYCIREAARAAR